MNPMELKRGIDKAVKAAVEELKKISQAYAQIKKRLLKLVRFLLTPMKTIGKIIAEAMDKVGKEGVITVEEG